MPRKPRQQPLTEALPAPPACEDVIRLIEQLDIREVEKLGQHLVDEAAVLPITPMRVTRLGGSWATGVYFPRDSRCADLVRWVIGLARLRPDIPETAINAWKLDRQKRQTDRDFADEYKQCKADLVAAGERITDVRIAGRMGFNREAPGKHMDDFKKRKKRCRKNGLL